jgi:aconitate hydratase
VDSARSELTVGDTTYEIHRLDELQSRYDVERLPYTLKILLENALRNGTEADVEAVATWDAKAEPSREMACTISAATLRGSTRSSPRSS